MPGALLSLARRGRSPLPRAPLRLRAREHSGIPTSVQGRASSERRTPPRGTGARPRALDRPPPGAASRAGVTPAAAPSGAPCPPFSAHSSPPGRASAPAMATWGKDWT